MPGQRTYDNLMLLKDAGAVVASGAATVGGQARFLDLGGSAAAILGVPTFYGVAIVDSTAIDTVTGDETYRVTIEGSNVSNFATKRELASKTIVVNGRTEIPFTNDDGGTQYQYIRAFLTLAGTTPSVNSVIWVTRP